MASGVRDPEPPRPSRALAHLAALLLLLLLPALLLASSSSPAAAAAAMHNNNWAVLVCTSRFW